MKFTTSDEQEITYKHTQGDNKLLVFIHGWLHDKSVWKKEQDHFTNNGYETLSIDLRGHGHSSTPEDIESYQLKRFAQDINELLVHEKLDNKEFILIGHSLGGMIALEYCKHYTTPNKLVLIDTAHTNPSKYVPLANKINWTPLTQKLVSYVKKHPHIKRKPQNIDFSDLPSAIPSWLAGLKQTTPHVILYCLKEILDLDEQELLKQIDIPTLIIVGEEDYVTPLAVSEEMHTHLKHSQLVKIQNSGHDSHRTHAQEVIKHIHEFIK